MARRMQIKGKKVIRADNGLVWSRNSGLGRYERGNYETELSGVRYELERRSWSPDSRVDDSGWYLSSFNLTNGFTGEWCGSTIVDAVDAATTKITYRSLEMEQNRS